MIYSVKLTKRKARRRQCRAALGFARCVLRQGGHKQHRAPINFAGAPAILEWVPR